MEPTRRRVMEVNRLEFTSEIHHDFPYVESQPSLTVWRLTTPVSLSYNMLLLEYLYPKSWVSVVAKGDKVLTASSRRRFESKVSAEDAVSQATKYIHDEVKKEVEMLQNTSYFFAFGKVPIKVV